MRILVTGGLGYIGSHTVVELMAAGHDVVVVDNLSNADISVRRRVQQITGREFTFQEADIRNRAAMQALFATHRIDAVVQHQLEALRERRVHQDVVPPGIITLARHIRQAHPHDFDVATSGGPQHLLREVGERWLFHVQAGPRNPPFQDRPRCLAVLVSGDAFHGRTCSELEQERLHLLVARSLGAI